MSFMTLKTIVFQNKKKFLLTSKFCFFLVVCLFSSRVKCRSNMTLLVSKEVVKKDWDILVDS